MNNKKDNKEKVSIFAMIASFLVPFVGIITFLLYRKDDKKRALISLILSILPSSLILFNPIIERVYYQNICNEYGSSYKVQKEGKAWKCYSSDNDKFYVGNIPYDPEHCQGSAKPIIYFYPTKDIKLNVKLGYPNNITTSYPKYNNEWNILAHIDGSLTDLNTGRNLYALYWEGLNNKEFNIEDGFIVKGEDSINFLEEKLKILGLSERETEEFIVYWLPILESNKYNYIRFATQDEINENMPLYISEEPDTLIRVLMIFKGLNKPIEVKEQALTPVKRKGFTVVEWGAVNLDKEFK